MDNLAKTVILSGNRDKGAKAILSLKGKKGEIKFYNMRELPKSLAVGIKQSGKVSKFPLNICGGVGVFDSQNKLNVEEPLVCAVVDVSNAFCPELLLCSNGVEKEENKNIETAFVQGEPEDRSTLYEETTDSEIDDLIDQNLKDDLSCHYYDACANCRYKKAFYEEDNYQKNTKVSANQIQNVNNCEDISERKTSLQDKKLSPKDKELDNSSNSEEPAFEEERNLEDKKEEKAGEIFYDQIRPQIEILFSQYPRDENLEKLVPNSRWVKVNYEGNEECYELGIICDDEGKEEYICYGIPSNDSQNPPKSIEEYAKYLKLSHTEGLWVACQDAKTGETIKLDFDKKL